MEYIIPCTLAWLLLTEPEEKSVQTPHLSNLSVGIHLSRVPQAACQRLHFSVRQTWLPPTYFLCGHLYQVLR
jgi:hypothetical protein